MCNTKSQEVKRSINKAVDTKDAAERLQVFEDASLLIYRVIKT